MEMLHKNPPAGILDQKKLFIFDMDGTIYLGKLVFDYAIRFIRHLRADGRRVLFFTNNASHSTAFYVDKLKRLGFEPTADEIMSSADVTVAYLHRHYPGKSVYLVGTCRLIRNGALYLCTHPDLNCPTDTGAIPDSGAIAAFITAVTGVTPRFLGKPYGEVVDMIEQVTGIDRRDMCIFGDRLYTDIALGTRHGVTSVLVLTGETSESDLAAAPADERPDMVYDSLHETDLALFGAGKEAEHGI